MRAVLFEVWLLIFLASWAKTADKPKQLDRPTKPSIASDRNGNVDNSNDKNAQARRMFAPPPTVSAVARSLLGHYCGLRS
jgi:hypothetical protein